MPNPVFRFTNAAETLTIDIEGTIGGGWFEEGATKEAVKAQLKEIAQSRAATIVVNINSYGGDVNHGISIHDLLAEHKAKVITNIHGHTASAATIVSQAGDVRRMSSNSLFLIHPASVIAWGNQQDIKTALSDLEKVDKTIAELYAKRTGKSVEEIRSIMDRFDGRGEWLTAEEAKDLGFIDEIYEPMKAVASVDPDIFNKLHLPGIPEDKLKTQNNEEMNADKKTVFGWFNEFLARMGVVKPKGEAEPGEETKEQPAQENPEKTEETQPAETTEPEKPAEETAKQEIIIKDMEEVRTVLDDLTTQNETQAMEIARLTAELKASQDEVARLGGMPTETEAKDDPFLDKSNLNNNEVNAQRNAEALRSAE